MSDLLELVEDPELTRLREKATAIGRSNGHGEAWQAPCRHSMCLSYYAGEGSPLREWIDETKKKRCRRKVACGLQELEDRIKGSKHMMTEEQYLLDCLMEECAEVIQRASKAIRFGIKEIQPGQDLNNRVRLEQELGDLLGVCDMLELTPNSTSRGLKPSKVRHYMGYSRKQGVLE